MLVTMGQIPRFGLGQRQQFEKFYLFTDFWDLTFWWSNSQALETIIIAKVVEYIL